MSRFFCALALCCITLPAWAEPIIRVALDKQAQNITVTVAGEKTTVSSDPKGIYFNNRWHDQDSFGFWPRSHEFFLNNQRHRGSLQGFLQKDGTMLLVNEMPLEDYLIGLIHGEISSRWPPEAIKAQAVAARTYALFKQKQRDKDEHRLYDLEITTQDQVYLGPDQQQKGDDTQLLNAIQETHGEVLWYFGYYPAYFHSCCGGETELVSRVWERKDSSASVIDPYCKNSPYFEWEYRISIKDFLQKLKAHGLSGTRITSLVAEPFEKSPRVATVVITTDQSTLYLRAVDLRMLLGPQALKSTWFDVDLNGRNVVFRGHGFGHGVGMCQWGAKGMASAGKTYKEILQFYYPQTTIRKIY